MSLSSEAVAITFTDDATRFVRLFLVAHKSEAASCFKIFLDETATLPDFHVRVLHSDSGTEYTGKAMTNLCLANGIRQEFSPPYTPQRNGVAERVGRTLQDAARAMLSSSGLLRGLLGRRHGDPIPRLSAARSATAPSMAPGSASTLPP